MQIEETAVNRRGVVIDLLNAQLPHREIESMTAEPVHGIKNLSRKLRNCVGLADARYRGFRGDGKNRNFTLDRTETEAFSARVRSGWGSAQATLEWLQEYRRSRGVEPCEMSLKTLYTIRSRILKQSPSGSGAGYERPGLVETLVASRDPLIWRDILRDRLLDCGASRRNLRKFLKKSHVEIRNWNSCWDRWSSSKSEETLWEIGEQMVGKGRFGALLKSAGAVKLKWPHSFNAQAIAPGQTWSIIGASSVGKESFIFLCKVPRIPRGGVFIRSGFAVVRGMRRYKNLSIDQQLRKVEYRRARKKGAALNSPVRISHATRALNSMHRKDDERAKERYLVLASATDFIDSRSEAVGSWAETLLCPDLCRWPLWNFGPFLKVRPPPPISS